MKLFVGGSTVKELEVDGRVASVEAGRVVKGVEGLGSSLGTTLRNVTQRNNALYARS